MAEMAQEIAQPGLGGGELALGQIGGFHELHGGRLAAAEKGGDLVLQPARASERLIPHAEKRLPIFFPSLRQRSPPRAAGTIAERILGGLFAETA
ncbi:MAG TPA: hypothetical protein VF113_12235 [Stellaceae bacterium]